MSENKKKQKTITAGAASDRASQFFSVEIEVHAVVSLKRPFTKDALEEILDHTEDGIMSGLISGEKVLSISGLVKETK